MTSSFRFDRDDQGIEGAANGPAIGDLLTNAAQQGAASAEGLGPRRATSFMNWRKSIRAVPARRTSEGMEAAFGSDSPGWHLVEYGTANTRPYAALRRAARAVGLRFEEG